jgi:twitching motility protein PilT
VTTPYASEAFLHQVLGKALAAEARDVHLKVGKPPGARVGADLVYFRGDKMRPEDTEAAARLILGGPAKVPHERVVGYEAADLGRFRATITRQRGALGLVLRAIPNRVPALDALGLPAVLAGLGEAGKGLVVVAGGAGQGKTTTIAALVGHLNAGFPWHLVTVEDPIEHVHEDARGAVSQREVGADTDSLASGVRAALRQDADAIAVSSADAGEALEASLDAAEAGRLVIAGLSAPDVKHAVARLFRSAGEGGRDRVAEALSAVVAQRLVRKRDGSGFVPALEILVASAAVREALKKAAAAGGSFDPAELWEKGAAHGMASFEAHLARLAAEGVIAKPA